MTAIFAGQSHEGRKVRGYAVSYCNILKREKKKQVNE
jgi:hypothetical protein